jgi:membrane fusion protein (multidrug efflux system)
MKEKASMFFSEEKNQKTFISPRVRIFGFWPGRLSQRQKKKSFASFLQKRRTFFLAFVVAATTARAQEPPAGVSTTVAHASDWQDRLQAVGTIRAVRGADLAAEIAGVVDSVDFDSGRDVAAGTVLLRLRPNDDDAKLADLQAAVQLAAENLARDSKQFHAQAVSQATMDADQSHLLSARAQVAQQQALMAEKIVRAPFAGRLGLRLVDQGQYLPAGTTIVTLQALDTLFVDFYLPQQTLAEVRIGDAAELRVDTYPGRVFPATISAISPKLDPVSRMLSVRATLPNHDLALLPGMFANVTMNVGPVHRYVTLPNAAIVYNPYGSLVYVVDHGKPDSVHQALIKTGPTRGDQIAVTQGLSEGQIVVTAGQIKLRQGSAIAVNNSVQPLDDPAPHPPEE